MGVLTGLFRVSSRVAKQIVAEPDLVDELERPKKDGPGELGLDAPPPTTDVDKAWEEIVTVLSATGHARASKALETGTDVEPESGAEVRVISATAVRKAAPVFAAIDTRGLAVLALERGVRDYYGKQLDSAKAGYVVSHIRTVIAFWKEAAAAGEAIVVVTA